MSEIEIAANEKAPRRVDESRIRWAPLGTHRGALHPSGSVDFGMMHVSVSGIGRYSVDVVQALRNAQTAEVEGRRISLGEIVKNIPELRSDPTDALELAIGENLLTLYEQVDGTQTF